MQAGPDFFRFAVDEAFDALLGDQGLDDRHLRRIEFTLEVLDAREYWDAPLGGTVPVSALVLRMEEYRTSDGFELPVSAKLASGRKPG